jgi:O-antigen/teichoic acid export membrane protein
MWLKIKNNQFLKHSAIFTIASALVNILGYLFHAISSRHLGPEKYSDVVTIIAYGLILSVPIMAANVIIVKKVGLEKTIEEKRQVVKAIEKALYELIKKNWFYLPIIYLVLMSLGYLNNLSIWSYLLMPIFVILFVFSQIYIPLLQSIKLFFNLSIVVVVVGLVKLTGAFTTTFIDSVVWLISMLIISALAQLWLGHHYTKLSTYKDVGKSLAFTFKNIIYHKKVQLIFFSILGVVLLNNLDVLFAKKFFSAHEAGLFGIWALFAKLIAYSSIPLSTVALVFFADKSSQQKSGKILFISILLIMGLGMTLLGAYWLFGSFILETFVGGEFLNIAQILPLAAVFGTFYSLVFVMNNYLLAQDSRAALIIPIAIPFLYTSVFAFAKSIQQLAMMDVVGSGVILVILLVSILKKYNIFVR